MQTRDKDSKKLGTILLNEFEDYSSDNNCYPRNIQLIKRAMVDITSQEVE